MRTNGNKIRGIAFDIDGTLYSNWHLYWRSAGFAMCHFRLIWHFNIVRQQIRQSAINNGAGYSNLYATQATMLATRLRISPEVAQTLLQDAIYTQWRDRIIATPLYRGARELLEYLHGKLPLAVMSDFPVAEKIKQWGIEHYFKYAISCEELGRLKPSTHLFHHLAATMHLKPQNILYIGNSYPNDVVGARAAGMSAWYLSKKTPRSIAAAGNYAGNYNELSAILHRVLA